MKHRRKTPKLKRNAAQRKALLSNQAASLIKNGRIRTTLAKAKALRPVAEKLVTLGKRGDLHARRQAIAYLRQKDVVSKLFGEIAEAAADRQGGYCRITKLGPRSSDAAPMAFIEFVDLDITVGEVEEDDAE
ncbi:50S ribosomal protein L17 [Roseibacillus ishigakijimensis]|uniref:Large ribosomal subunit protein bL17 n=1 Tax=Roseibacillus ishigakijimensis TaxID=454146 RepID=A0A934VI81_9BACT|nr:50S ribosomal protein L17 [Roseibacillus ishigakijimensis]MBK1834798.1 50S ribosomal protein L17 [Roseibacillus ishigakijimensis]